VDEIDTENVVRPLNPNSISGLDDYRVQSLNSLILTQFGFLWRSVKKTLQLQLRNCQNRNSQSLKSDIYFRFVWETIGVDPTTLPSRMQNLVKTVKNCGCNRSSNDLLTDTRIHARTHTQTPKWLDSLSNALDRQLMRFHYVCVFKLLNYWNVCNFCYCI